MKRRGPCEAPDCLTSHEWVMCDDCWLGVHCMDACPVPVPVYIRQLTDDDSDS